MEISCEAERQSLLFASRNLDVISCMSEIADNGSRGVSARSQWLQSRQCASDNGNIYRLGLVVREIEERLCRVPVYELHAEDLRLGEGGGDGDGEIGCRWGRLELFFSLEDGEVSFEWRLGDCAGN